MLRSMRCLCSDRDMTGQPMGSQPEGRRRKETFCFTIPPLIHKVKESLESLEMRGEVIIIRYICLCPAILKVTVQRFDQSGFVEVYV